MAKLLDKTRTGTLHVLPAQAIIKVIGLLYVVVLARGLSVEDYGIYNFVAGALLIFGYLCNFGVASSLQRFLPEYQKLEKFGLLLKTIVFSHLFRLALSLIALLAANLSFPVWAETFNVENYQTEFIIFSIGAVLYFQLEYLQIEFNSLFHHGSSSIIQLVYSVLKFVAVGFFLYSGAKLTGVLIAEGVSYLLALMLGAYIFIVKVYRPYRKYLGKAGQEKLEYRRVGRYSGYNALVTPGGILYSHSADYFVIAAIATPFELGLYALGSRASKMLVSVMPQNVMQPVLRPAIYHHYYSVSDREKSLKKIFRSMTLLIGLFLFPAVFIMAATSVPTIKYVFGDEYVAANYVFLMLICFNLFTLLEFPSDMVLQVIEKVEIRAYAQIFAVYNILAAIALMPSYGILGVAFATGSALMFKCLYFYFMAKRYAGIALDYPAMLRIGINAAVSGVASYGVMSLRDSGWMLVLALAAGGVVYALMTYLNNPMSHDEKVMANLFLKRRIFNV